MGTERNEKTNLIWSGFFFTFSGLCWQNDNASVRISFNLKLNLMRKIWRKNKYILNLLIKCLIWKMTCIPLKIIRFLFFFVNDPQKKVVLNFKNKTCDVAEPFFLWIDYFVVTAYVCFIKINVCNYFLTKMHFLILVYNIKYKCNQITQSNGSTMVCTKKKI